LKVAIAAWVGAGNLGDELLLAALLQLLRRRTATPLVLSWTPDETRRLHGVAAAGGRSLPRVLREADGLVFGGGGLVQDETSLLSPAYQLHRPLLAGLLGVPLVGVGLGAGPLQAPTSRWLARRSLSPALGVAVRDEASLDTLRQLGLRNVELAADLAFTLTPPADVPLEDEVVVALRPRFPAGGILPGRLRRRQPDQGRFVVAVAAQLDRIAGATGARVRLLSMEPSRDDPLHRAIADRMVSSVVLEPVTLPQLVPTIARARLVIASRFHAAVVATLCGRPALMLGYASKVRELAAALGPAGVVLDHSTAAIAELPAAATRALAVPLDAVLAGRDRMAARAAVNVAVLDRLMSGPGRVNRRARPTR
jgi:polysaccharide pyruvyl transferase CsaB